MLGAGYFNPLPGYMNLADALAVAENMHMGSGLFWPVPILHMTTRDKVTDEFRTTGQIALRDPNVEGNPILAIQEVNAIEEMAAEQIETIVGHVFRTTDQEHPGVAAFKAAGNIADLRPDPGAEPFLLPHRFPQYVPHGAGNPPVDPGHGLEHRGRFPDP